MHVKIGYKNKDVTLERIEQTVEVVAAKTRASIEDSIQNSEISSDPEVKIKKDIEWTETDEQWKNRRTKVILPCK